MVLDRAKAKTDPMEFREDFWAHELRESLNAASCFFEPGHSSPSCPLELAHTRAFEVSMPHKVAIWHGGFDASAERLDGVVPWLRGGTEDVLIPSSQV